MVEKQCPRCGKKFDCHHDDDIRICQCAGIRLTDGARLYLHLHYDNQCLCANCLIQLNEIFPNAEEKQ
jgi:hypothetical protein